MNKTNTATQLTKKTHPNLYTEHRDRDQKDYSCGNFSSY